MANDFEFEVLSPFNSTSVNITATDFSNFGNKNVFYQGADLAWMMVASALVLLMVPGLGLFYSGMSDHRSHLSMMWLPMITTALIGVQWFMFGYSITFSGPNKFWGGDYSLLLRNDLSIPFPSYGTEPGIKIPVLVHAFYQGMFACFTAAVVCGAAIRKGRPLHFLVFILIWSTIVYDPIARATWNPIGWSNYWKGETSGVFDFAGGTVVHIVSATTSAVYSGFCDWKRPIFGMRALTPENKQALTKRARSQSPSNVLLGTILLWIGWFGFNGGSALGANLRAVSACISTQIAACAGGVMGTLIDYFIASTKGHQARFSITGFCNGAIAGLVAITPAAGYVPVWSAPIFGISGILCVAIAADILESSKRFYDYNDIFVVHGVAGWVGMLLTAAFARSEIAALDGYSVIINHGWQQLGIQVLDAVVGMLWSGVGTFLILCFQEFILVIYYRHYRNIKAAEEPEFRIITDDEDFFYDDISHGDEENGRHSRANTDGAGTVVSGVGGLDERPRRMDAINFRNQGEVEDDYELVSLGEQPPRQQGGQQSGNGRGSRLVRGGEGPVSLGPGSGGRLEVSSIGT